MSRPQEYQIPKYESEVINPETLASSEALVVHSMPENEILPTSYYEKKVANAFAVEKNHNDLVRINDNGLSILDARKRLIEKTLFVRKAKKNWVGKTVNLLVGGNADNRPKTFGSPQELTEQRLMQHESVIGSELLGTPENGGQQTFFMNETGDWFWHEESEDGKSQLTTRYKVGEEVLKMQDGHAYEIIKGQEVDNLVQMTELYRNEVTRRIYSQSGYDLAA